MSEKLAISLMQLTCFVVVCERRTELEKLQLGDSEATTEPAWARTLWHVRMICGKDTATWRADTCKRVMKRLRLVEVSMRVTERS